MMSKKQIRLWLWSASILAVFNILTKINDQSLTGIVVQLLLKTCLLYTSPSPRD